MGCIGNCAINENNHMCCLECPDHVDCSECYYLCVARGCKMLFVSDVCFAVNDWDKNDPRIHKDANCRYRDNRTALDIIYELIKADMLKSEWE